MGCRRGFRAVVRDPVHPPAWRVRGWVGLAGIVGLIAGFAFPSSAFAVTSEIRLGPTNLAQPIGTFAVSSRSTRAGVSFRVTLTARDHSLPPDLRVDLAITTRRRTETSESQQITPLAEGPVVRVTEGRRRRVASVVVTSPLLSQPGLCLRWTAPVHVQIRGLDQVMPAVCMYSVMLGEFINPSTPR